MPCAPHATATRADVESVLRCAKTRAVPLFLPAIYEHKAWFVRSTPSAISRDAGLLSRALLAEFEAIGPDALTVGVDVYNLEAEAVGCRVTFYDGDDTSVPGISPGDHVLKVGDDLERAPIPNPLRAGRMPVNIAAARQVRQELGSDYWIRGALSGPLSLAVSMVGAETLFIACLEEPAWVHQVLAYAGRIIREFGKGYIDAGAELVVFDSQASPDLLPPAMYEEFVMPVMRELVGWAAAEGVRDVPLVIGGNTTSIVNVLARTGANNLLCDFTADWEQWVPLCVGAGRAWRRNISPRFIESDTAEAIYAAAAAEIRRARSLPGFIMGTGVIPFGVPTAKLLAIKQACLDAGKA